MSALIVIPARYGSTRFPGKPLARQTGKFLIQHVVEQAQRATRASGVVVATDDHRIIDAVRSFGATAVMTSTAHHSGTDRIAEVLRRTEFAATEVVVNVQGDEPEIDPALIDELIRVTQGEVSMATAAAPFEHARDVDSPNQVKVVTDRHGFALYFSRAAIPFDRDRAPSAGPHTPHAIPFYRKHLGIYAYRRNTLLELASSPMCDLERMEKLEQLRALYLGIRIYIASTDRAPHGVDTPEDYAAFVKRYNSAQSPPRT